MSPADWRPRNVPLPEPHLLGLGLSLILHRVRPTRLPGGVISKAVGTLLLLGGAGLAVSATRAAGRTELATPNQLIVTGPYALGRNPMYVGWTLVYVGCAFIAGTAWPLVLLPGVSALIHNQVIAEEHQLEIRFGEEYRTYALQVRRYI